jgi:periodic tryptophan protein 1
LLDADIERIKEIAHVELEDARTELERANVTAQAMDKRHEESDDNDMTGDDDDDDSAWVEYVLRLLPRIAD